jgi:hypothetical protein
VGRRNQADSIASSLLEGSDHLPLTAGFVRNDLCA